MNTSKNSFLPYFGMSTLLLSKVKSLTKHTKFANISPRKKTGLKKSFNSKSSKIRAKHHQYTEEHPRFKEDVMMLFRKKSKDKLPRLKGRKLVLGKETTTNNLKRTFKGRNAIDHPIYQNLRHTRKT